MGRGLGHVTDRSDNVILIDSSAWIEFLRDTDTWVCLRVNELLESRIATCDPIRMEILAGARSERHLQGLRGLLARAETIPTLPRDFDRAAALYRECRVRGQTIRRLIDCLIGSIAIRADAAVLHCDRDFDVLARCTGLRIDPTR